MVNNALDSRVLTVRDSLGAEPQVQKRLGSSAFKTGVLQRVLYILDRAQAPFMRDIEALAVFGLLLPFATIVADASRA